jgi:hypothetical protein
MGYHGNIWEAMPDYGFYELNKGFTQAQKDKKLPLQSAQRTRKAHFMTITSDCLPDGEALRCFKMLGGNR